MKNTKTGLNVVLVCVDEGLSVPETARAIAAKTGEPFAVVYQRWYRWLCKKPGGWGKLEKDLAAIGYKITIEKI